MGFSHDRSMNKLTASMNNGFKGLRDNKGLAICLFLLGAGVFALYTEAFRWLFDIWMHDRAYSHGFVIPLITVYLVWLKRDQLGALRRKPRYLQGGVLIACSYALLLVGRVGVVAQIETMSFMLLLPAVVLFVWGWRHCALLAFPLFYLQFMVPWVDEFLNMVHLPFQQMTAVLSANFLRFLGFSVFREGIFLSLPDISIEVARECSGVSFFISVLAIGIPLVYLTQRTWLKALTVLSAGVLLVILSNGIRVTIAAILGEKYGEEMLHGPGHIFRGWFVAQVGWVGVFLVNWLVGKIPPKTGLRLFEKGKKSQPDDARRGPTRSATTPVAPLSLIVGTMAVLTLYLQFWAVPRPVPPSNPIHSIPGEFGVWKGEDAAWLKGVTFFQGADESMERIYRDDQGQWVNVYVGYYHAQNQEKRLTSFHDRRLHSRSEVVSEGFPADVNHGMVTIGNERYEFVFWYWFPTGIQTERYKAKMRGLFNTLLYRKNNAAVLFFARPCSAEKEVPSDILQEFVKQFAPLCERIFP